MLSVVIILLFEFIISISLHFFRVCMKYIDAAMERLKEKKEKQGQNVHDSELSLIEKILAKEPDPKIAYILALDLILVGIDTVKI